MVPPTGTDVGHDKTKKSFGKDIIQFRFDLWLTAIRDDDVHDDDGDGDDFNCTIIVDHSSG